MRKTLPTLATVALLAALGALGSAAPAWAAAGISPARGFAPGHVVVKFDGQERGRTLAFGDPERRSI